MNRTKKILYYTLFLCTSASAHAGLNFVILDTYTSRAPTGNTYTQLTVYDQYVDAGSIDASPFVIDKLTSNTGGIVFYGSTELTAQANANTFRLTSTSGNFDFNSFNLLQLEEFGTSGGEADMPSLTLNSSLGDEVTYAATSSAFEIDPGVFYYSWNFSDTGVKNLNWANVEWVEFTSQFTKAKMNNLDLNTVPEPKTYAMILATVAAVVVASRRRRRG